MIRNVFAISSSITSFLYLDKNSWKHIPEVWHIQVRNGAPALTLKMADNEDFVLNYDTCRMFGTKPAQPTCQNIKEKMISHV